MRLLVRGLLTPVALSSAVTRLLPICTRVSLRYHNDSRPRDSRCISASCHMPYP